MGFKRLRGKRENKVNPIPRDRDNSADLETAEMRVHAKYKGLQHPGEGSQFNNQTRTAP